MRHTVALIIGLLFFTSLVQATPLAALEKGNQRFESAKSIPYNQRAQLKKHMSSQHPSAVLLSCMDSRVPPEIIFNQKIGSLFVIRNAGNVEDPDVLASLEYATKVIHTPLIIVMGHTGCGAMSAACQQVKLGNITQLTANLQPAVKRAELNMKSSNCDDPRLINEIAKQNVYYQAGQILYRSPIISNLVKENKVTIKGAMFDLKTGKATLFPVKVTATHSTV